MDFEIGIVCGRCDLYSGMGTKVCPCGHGLALFASIPPGQKRSSKSDVERISGSSYSKVSDAHDPNSVPDNVWFTWTETGKVTGQEFTDPNDPFGSLVGPVYSGRATGCLRDHPREERGCSDRRGPRPRAGPATGRPNGRGDRRGFGLD